MAFDDFMSGAKRYVDAAAEAANGFVDVSRIRMEKTQIITSLNEEYRRLGRLYFKAEDTGEEDIYAAEMVDSIEKIRELKAKLKKTEDDINAKKAQNRRVCPNCGENVPKTVYFCPNCGAELPL